MLHLTIPAHEIFNSKTEQFKIIGGGEIDLEYSLYTIALWESIFQRPYISKQEMTRAELVGLYKAMCVTPDISDTVWLGITPAIEKEIADYMTNPMSASKVNRNAIVTKSKNRHEVITAEVIYFQMATFGIPFECEHWHFNRLMRLIEVCAVKNAPPKKMSKAEAARQWNEQNEAMRKKLNSRG